MPTDKQQPEPCSDAVPVETVRRIVREEMTPFANAATDRMRQLESDHGQLREQVQELGTSTTDHGNRLLRIEGKLETVIGSPGVEGQLPKMERKMEAEWAKAQTFRHASMNAHQTVLDALSLLQTRWARNEGELSGALKQKEKTTAWLKWLLGGLATFMLGSVTGARAAIWEAIKHFAWGK